MPPSSVISGEVRCPADLHTIIYKSKRKSLNIVLLMDVIVNIPGIWPVASGKKQYYLHKVLAFNYMGIYNCYS